MVKSTLKIIGLTSILIFLCACQKTQYQDFEVAEFLPVACQVDLDCKTPVDYLIRSSCPYESKCLENRCAVVCPEPFNHP